jgi:hypothetical protein
MFKKTLKRWKDCFIAALTGQRGLILGRMMINDITRAVVSSTYIRVSLHNNIVHIN